MKRHERPRASGIRVETPVKGKWCDLSLAQKRQHVFDQLKQLGPVNKQANITCLCGKTVPVMYAYRCFMCGAFWCPKCAGEHFGLIQQVKERREKCKHVAVARIRGKDVVCSVSIVKKYSLSMARVYWVALGTPPDKEVEKFVKLFKKNPYCPKCGQKLNFERNQKGKVTATEAKRVE